MTIKKIGSQVCVVHGHKKKKGSKRDKPKGTPIKCFPNTKDGRKKARAMHTAIVINQKKRR